MKRQQSFLFMRHREVLVRAGILAVTIAIVVIGFNWSQRNDENSGLAEGSLIVNVNSATPEEIATVPGVGTLRAMQIISSRPYATIDELERVYGITAEQVERMRPYITVEGETRKRPHANIGARSRSIAVVPPTTTTTASVNRTPVMASARAARNVSNLPLLNMTLSLNG